MNYVVTAVARGTKIPTGNTLSMVVFNDEKDALQRAKDWLKAGQYDVYIYTMAAKVGVPVQPIIVDRSVEVFLSAK